MALTKGHITKIALETLAYRNCYVWRQNNIAVKGRTFIGLKGVPDIIGFHNISGIAVYCEVKTLTDKFSEYQIDFMRKAKKAGCFCMLATEQDGKVVLLDWQND